MICPHCSANLLYKERTGNTCSKCRKSFALEPKSAPHGLSDVGLRRAVERLTADGRITVTVGQLHYATGRRHLVGGAAPERRGSLGCAIPALLAGLPTLGFALPHPAGAGAVAALAGLALVAIGIRSAVRWTRFKPMKPRELLWSADDFRRSVTDPWQRRYGVLPRGLVTEDSVRPRPPAAPVAAVLCEDRTVRTFLQANAFEERHRVLVVPDPASVPAGLPVVVLHDAGAEGCLSVGRARAALAGHRVLDGGLPPRAVMAQPKALQLRQPDVLPRTMELLRAEGGLGEAELGWLAEGWWSPLAAVPPTALLDAATRAVERLAAAVRAEDDPAEVRRRALAVGFLTWPEQST
ncbi:hypothetical protein GCM10018781_65130 [Kitasatospora indigofera]|uniref:Uncharacterized protein n=1 Tax=Kitasatospora indigofera TaxID=67307 RepID=A0A919L383_9ACTN|nr:hypothetical protein [Kitasatospora indigofera]GHH81774.1 hypothetical protein GCM10018781_65130 [Kitasatospora indigofera]